MKFYDKKMYQIEQNMKTIFLMLIVFMASFILGYVICKYEKQIVIEEMQTKIDEQYVELDSLRESVYILQMYGK